jgi:EAL domain-containing protein (putative c-di-GMP-specific phosphodiesterase class I)
MKPVSGALLVGEVRRAARLHQLAATRRQAMRLLEVEEGEAERLAELDRALDGAMSSMWMAYQPIVRTDGTVYGYEALMRSDEARLPSPPAVIDAASRLGRLEELGRVARERALGPFSAAPPDAALFVNLHARDVLDPLLLDPSGPLAPYASRVVLEITERASLADMRDLRPRVGALRSAGFRIAVDDLGAGYSGLSSFILLEPELVKIDMSLVRDVDTNPTKRRLVRMIAATCRDMGIAVVAEGIETEAEQETVIELGCGLLQGYRIARPGRPFPGVHWTRRTGGT